MITDDIKDSIGDSVMKPIFNSIRIPVSNSIRLSVEFYPRKFVEDELYGTFVTSVKNSVLRFTNEKVKEH